MSKNYLNTHYDKESQTIPAGIVWDFDSHNTEIYLKAFERIVKTEDSWYSMPAYNLVNDRRSPECGEMPGMNEKRIITLDQ